MEAARHRAAIYLGLFQLVAAWARRGSPPLMSSGTSKEPQPAFASDATKPSIERPSLQTRRRTAR